MCTCGCLERAEEVLKENQQGESGGIRPAAKYPPLPNCVTDEREALLQECPDSVEREYRQIQLVLFSLKA